MVLLAAFVFMLATGLLGLWHADEMRDIVSRQFNDEQLVIARNVAGLIGHATAESAVDGLKSGATDYLTKPISIDDLTAKAEEAFAKRLKMRNIDVREAESGDRCLSMMERDIVDVVVLDVKMPGMDGFEVLDHIKKRYPSCEVIMLTGHATHQDGIKGIKSGAFDFITKPVEFDHLLGKINQAYERVKRIKTEKKEAAFRVQMELQLLATERMAALAMATGVAHEINNPLAIIQESAGWMRQLLEKPESKDYARKNDFEKALGKICGAVDRASRILYSTS
jgi:DNA-binding NtrC family response regulator